MSRDREEATRVGVMSALAGMAAGILIRNDIEGLVLIVLVIAGFLYGIHAFLISRGRQNAGTLKVGELLAGIGGLAAVLSAGFSVPESGRATLGGIILIVSVAAFIYGFFFREPVVKGND